MIGEARIHILRDPDGQAADRLNEFLRVFPELLERRKLKARARWEDGFYMEIKRSGDGPLMVKGWTDRRLDSGAGDKFGIVYMLDESLDEEPE